MYLLKEPLALYEKKKELVKTLVKAGKFNRKVAVVSIKF
jgi:polyhydroxyalkanoate synthesis regulator phasin